ncbi:MAG: hypothetical protein KDI59_06570, partial [Xanthomonadales bacterium]|nr:hypothetical protein [Xanthomonadales bacterium]
MVKELCWICNFNDANSNEHMFKKSDIKQHTGFSKISKMFRSINFGRKFPIQGIKSKDFCFQTQICTHCNNSATQPYDRAWEILSAYLYDNFETLKSKGF